MKPLKLHLKNIGPFLDETLDFENLSEMFLVTGKTGSGKTTIFDAITYALYGDTSGSRNISNFHLHSDFAAPDEKSFVEFTFLLNGNKYRINRTTSWEYVNRNGNISRTLIKTSFEAYDSASSEWKEFPGTTTQLDSKIKDLIGLSCEEFTKIVILPQGEFAKFLHESSASRRDTLLKLFPVSIYTDIARQISEQAKEKSEELNHVEKNLTEAQKNPLLEDSEKKLNEIKKELEELKKEAGESEKTILSITSQTEKLKSKKEDAFKAKKYSEKLNTLIEKQPQMEEQSKSIARSQEAALLLPKIENCSSSQKRLDEAKQNLETTEKDITSSAQMLNSLLAQKEEYSKKEILLGNKVQSKSELEKLLLPLQKINTLLQDISQSQRTFVKLKTETQSITKFLDSQIKSLAENSTSLTENISQKKELIERLENQKHEQEIQDAAGFIAESLEEGKPCPVCGSTTHPSCAKKLLTTQNYETLIANEKKLLAETEDSLKQTEKNLTETKHLSEQNALLSEKLANAWQEMQNRYFILQKDFSLAEALPLAESGAVTIQTESFAQKKNYTSKDQLSFSRKTDDAITESNKLLTELETLLSQNKNIKGKTEESLKSEIISLSKEIEELSGQTKAFAEKLAAADKLNSNLEERKSAFAKQIEEETKILSSYTKQMEEAMGKSSFKTQDEVQKAFVEQSVLEEQKKQLQEYQTELTQTKAALNELKAKPQEYEELTQQLDSLQDKLKQTVSQKNEALEKQDELKETLSDIQKAVSDLEKYQSMQKQLREENEILFQLDRDLNGKNPRKILFDTWVLGTFLEDIVTSANIHFAQISASRYCFILKTEGGKGNGYKGLDLSVYDSFTGKERESTSLSGGETFMASLSLALALTDVVQQRSGSIRLDSLFIDEGFGSLDGEALENAVSILNSIREERMVGIISHVEALENAIPCHVSVIKRNTGSTISIS